MKLAEINASIRVTEHQLKVLPGDQATTTETTRLLDDEGAESRNLGTPRGPFNRTSLETLGDTGETPPVRRVAEHKARGKAMDRRQMDPLETKVRSGLPRLSDKL